MTEDYLQRFGGVGRLFGAAGLERLGAAHVCVIGIGGVGSWAVEALARSGVGAITMIDLDDVCITNINRQLPALEGEIGRPKGVVLAERVRRINPTCRVTVVSEFFTAANAGALLAPRFDAVVDCVDLMSHKALLIASCVERGLPCVTVGGAGGRCDVSSIRVGDLGEAVSDELLRQVRKRLRRDHGFARGEGNHYDVRAVFSLERPIYAWADGSCQSTPEPGTHLKLDCAGGLGAGVFVTGAFGFAAAGEVVRRIAAGEGRSWR